MSTQAIIDILKRDCGEYLNIAAELEVPLMRGMEKCPQERHFNLAPNQFTSRHGYDKPFFDKMVDNRLKRLKLLQRADATFATTDMEIAQGFGPMFYVFPKNGFRYAYTEGISDLYPKFESWIRYEWNPGAHTCSAMVADLLCDAMGDLTIIDIYCDRSPTFKKYIRQKFVEAQNYCGDELDLAMEHGWEIWFDGPYHALPIDHADSMHIVEALGLNSQVYAMENAS